MLISYHRGFILKGYADFTERKFFKKVMKRSPIYFSTGICGVCDDSELETEVAKKIDEKMQSGGWGNNFSGWQEICTDEEELREAFAYTQESDDFYKRNCSESITVTPIKEWKMSRIIKELNGEQFAQFCRENGIAELKLK